MGKFTQSLMWEGEPVEKRQKKRSAKSRSCIPIARIFDPEAEPAPIERNREGDRIGHCMMVAADLRSVMYTGWVGDVTEVDDSCVFGDVRDGAVPEKARKLDRELFERIRERVELSKSVYMPEVQRELILERFRVIEDFASSEGFCG